MVWFYLFTHITLPLNSKNVFQSHYGLILSWRRRGLGRFFRAFNPTMVWFYRKSSGEVRGGLLLSIPLWSDFIFQRRRSWVGWGRTFNPTMVWFYPFLVFFVSFFLLTFNPTMVWFYLAGFFVWLCKIRQSFNPTMVWFYQNWIQRNRKSIRSFQSHYGLILSPQNSSLASMRLTGFQSHYGLILSSYCNSRYFVKNSLSIPLWSDFIYFWASAISHSPPFNFQSHYGLILSRYVGEISTENSKTTFNPTMVWFYLEKFTPRRGRNREAFNPTMVWFYHLRGCIGALWEDMQLSIPLWSDFIGVQ